MQCTPMRAICEPGDEEGKEQAEAGAACEGSGRDRPVPYVRLDAASEERLSRDGGLLREVWQEGTHPGSLLEDHLCFQGGASDGHVNCPESSAGESEVCTFVGSPGEPAVPGHSQAHGPDQHPGLPGWSHGDQIVAQQLIQTDQAQ